LCYYVSVMKHLTEHLYTYDRQEFFPIFEEGNLVNRNEFVAYKLHRVARHLGHFIHNGTDKLVKGIDQIIEANNNTGVDS
jgi:tRNA(Ile2) C34 agmatinyltransferase TiaS